MKNTKIFALVCCAVFLLPLFGTIRSEADSPRVTFFFRGGRGIHVLLINLEKRELVDINWTIQIFEQNDMEKKNFSGFIDSITSKGSVKIATGPFFLPMGKYSYRFIIDPPGEWDETGAVGPSLIIGNWIFCRPFLDPIPPTN
jgi:hypothetical protein